jgi:hypothetical protein
MQNLLQQTQQAKTAVLGLLVIDAMPSDPR